MRIAATLLAVLALPLAAPAIARADAAAVGATSAAQAAAHPQLVTAVRYGKSRGDRDLVAYRVGNDGPNVVYTAGQDGADAIAVDVQQRLFAHVVAHPVAGVSLWFVPVADPDGYDGHPSGVAFDRN